MSGTRGRSGPSGPFRLWFLHSSDSGFLPPDATLEPVPGRRETRSQRVDILLPPSQSVPETQREVGSKDSDTIRTGRTPDD